MNRNKYWGHVLLLTTCLALVPMLFAQNGGETKDDSVEFVTVLLLIVILTGLGYLVRKQPFEFTKDNNSLTVRRSDLSRYLSAVISLVFMGIPLVVLSDQIFDPERSIDTDTTLLLTAWILIVLYRGVSVFIECEIKMNNNNRKIYKNGKFFLNYSEVLSFHVKEFVTKSRRHKYYYFIVSIQTRTGHKHRLFKLSNYDIAEDIVVNMDNFVSRGGIRR
ncbi:MAG: hypothetical protein HN356_10485 [Calditrichaeota bacterium]|nr:hypothetical protein [Calditrichota bacterium]